MCKYQMNGLKLPSILVLLPERELKKLKFLSFLTTGTSENHLFLLCLMPTLKIEGVTIFGSYDSEIYVNQSSRPVGKKY